jgi:hypothetical protein
VDAIANTLKKDKKDKAQLRFFVKGGAAATLLLTREPRKIVNDIDCALLVNPELPTFEETRIKAASKCINRIVTFVNELAATTCAYIRKHGVHYGIASLSSPPPLRVGRAAPDGTSFKTGIEEFIATNGLALKPECPFFIEVWPSLIFRGESLQMAVIKLCTHTEPPLSLIDIAIPTQSYSHLPYEWENYMVDPFTVYKLTIPLLSPSAQIYNQKRAEALTIRGLTANFNAKANRRKVRIEKLKKMFNTAPAAASAAPAAALNTLAAAGGAGAAAPSMSLPAVSVPVSARNSTRRNNRRNNRIPPPFNYRSLPLGKPLNFVRKPPQGDSKKLLNTRRVIPVLNTEGRILQLKHVPSQYLGAHHSVYRDLRPKSSQFVVLDREGYFQPLGRDPVRDPATGQWGILGYDRIMYFFE